MRGLIGWILAAALSSPAFAEPTKCAGYADERLDALMRNVALLAEQIDAGLHGQTPLLAEQTSRLRELIDEPGSGADAVACDMVTRFPALEAALAEATQDLARPGIRGWLEEAGRDARSGESRLSCLDASDYRTLRNAMFLLEVTNFIQQGVCDSLSCSVGVCRVCTVTGAIAGAVLPPFEAVLAIDGLFCSTQHANDMTAYCRVPNGHCSESRATASTLVELESQLSGPLVATLNGLSDDVATDSTLRSTRELIDTRVDRTLQQIDSAAQGLAADAARRETFQEDLRVLEIERALAIDSGSVPVQLQLPRFAGGSLEEVREVVADAIVASLEAGLAINQAQVLRREGDDHLNAGEFRSAFLAYRDAYRELVR